jgi:hypothetical protein
MKRTDLHVLSAGMLFGWVFFVMSIGGGSTANGAILHVDQAHPNAADDNPGTVEQPFLTIGAAAERALPGDIVQVSPGVYPERIIAAAGGEEGAPITYISTALHGAEMHGFNTVDAPYLIIDGFSITNSDLFTGWDETQGVLVHSDFVTVRNCLFHHMHGTAIVGYWHEPFPHATSIVGNTIYHVQMGITIQGTDWLVEENEVRRLVMHSDGGDCDYSRFFGENHVIRRNLFHGTDFDEIGSAHVDCFQTFTNNGEHARDILFEANTCMDFHQGLMASNVEATDTGRFIFRNNVFARGHAWGLCVHEVDEVQVENNTFYDIAYHGAGFRDNSIGNVIRNNIFMNVSSSYWASDGGEVTGDHNIIFNANVPENPGPNDLVDTDPLLVDPEKGNFRLNGDSPAIDSGQELTAVTIDHDGVLRPQGSGWDVGAFEYTTSSPLTISTMSLPEGVVHSPYTATLFAAGGTPPYSWSTVDSILPTGLTLTTNNGEIAGTPTEPGVSVLAVQTTDSQAATAQKKLTLPIQQFAGKEKSGCGCHINQNRSHPRQSTPMFLILTLLFFFAGLYFYRI